MTTLSQQPPESPDPAKPPSGALAGLRVIDASNFVFGPVATQMLGDMGADVIKIEPPEGDPTRGIGQSRTPGMGSFFLNVNRNKRSVKLDLKTPEGAHALQRLLGTADVFVHNMRSTAVARLGLEYSVLAGLYPRLVYAAAQGFGNGGRYFDRPAYDDVIQGLSGLSGLNAGMGGPASYLPMLMTDKLCGLFLYSAIATALVYREKTRQGQEVQVPMFESTVAFNLLEHLADAVFIPPPTEISRPLGYARMFSPAHRPLATQDGFLCLVANTNAQWQRLFVAIGRDDLRADPRFESIGNRMKHVVTLYGLVEEQLRSRGTGEWLGLFEASDIPAGPAHDFEGVRNDRHLADRKFFRTFEHDSEGALLMTEVPTLFSKSPGGLRLGPPRLGQHTEEVLQELGYGVAEIAALTQ